VDHWETRGGLSGRVDILSSPLMWGSELYLLRTAAMLCLHHLLCLSG
jgi:hypothetical protein